jgi:hypothetical protein
MRKVLLLAYEQFPHAGGREAFCELARGALGKGSDDELLGYSLGWPLEAELVRQFPLKLAVYVQVLYVIHLIFPSTGCPTCSPRRG